VFTEPGRRLKTVVQYCLAAVGVPVWIASALRVSVLGQMPGVIVLAALVAAAFTLQRGPATLAIVVGAIGLEFILNPATALVHLQRMVVVCIVGGALVALAYGRTAGLLAAQRYKVLFERHPLPMFVFDEETLAFLSVNEATIRIYGYTEAEFLGMSIRDLRTPEEALLLDSRAGPTGAEISLVTRHRTKSGEVLDVQIRSQMVPYQGRRARLALIENITEQRVLEAQLRQVQKMDAIGQLAGGIAHDFNNLLTAIRGYASLLLDGLPPGDSRREDVLEIERAGERATALTRQLLAFSRKQILQERVISVNEVVDGLTPMLRRLVGEAIHVRTLTKSAGFVTADPSQLEQVLLNLVVNARDALPSGGEIIVETSDTVLEDPYTRTHPAARPGPHAVLVVSDNGVGMSPEVQARAFEPFFTTKAAGQGTGLGLSTVYGIVKQSGGHVWIYSEVGRGTTIKVYLPLTDEAAERADLPAAVTRTAPSQRASVLLVEDEESVRALLAKVLTRAGYVVHTAVTAADARMLLARDGTRFDLLITDVVLSRESGREVAEAVLRVQPHCRVLYISGYTDDAVVRHGILTEQMPFLQKPFSAASLLDKVASVLAAASH
jgi:two-component system cell cycle sensor histidine kinase/response regulator CckA